MSKRELPDLHADEEAERFLEEADLSAYDLSGAKRARFKMETEPYRFEILVEAPTAYVLRLLRGSEVVFDTRPYATRLEALGAARSMKAHMATAILADEIPRSKTS